MQGMPALGQGKHSRRLYAARRSRACPASPLSPRGSERTKERRDRLLKKEKTEIITMRIKPQYKQEIQQKAKQSQLTVTDYLTFCGMAKQIVQINGLDEILSELKAQGRNLNQLTTLANMGQIEIVDATKLLQVYANLYFKLNELLKEVS